MILEKVRSLSDFEETTTDIKVGALDLSQLTFLLSKLLPMQNKKQQLSSQFLE